MTTVAKISISLPQDLLAKIESERESSGQSRSEFFVQLVESYLKKKRIQELDEQYRRAYELQPETEEEIAFFREAAKKVWEANPWEPETEAKP